VRRECGGEGSGGRRERRGVFWTELDITYPTVSIM